MSKQIDALKLALEALDQLTNVADTFSVSGVYLNEEVWAKKCLSDAYFAITTIEEALAQPEQPKVRTGDCLLVGVCASEGHKIQKAQPEQEPVACTSLCVECTKRGDWVCAKVIPPQRTWVGLTDEEFQYCVELKNAESIAEEVEAKLKEKNT